MTCLHGQRSTSKRSAGSKRVSLRPLWMTCVPYCDWPKGATKSRRRPFLTAERCNRVRKAAIELAMTEPNGAKGARCIWLSIPWDTCFRCTSRQPMSRIALRWANWPPPSRKRQTTMSSWLIWDQGYTGDEPAQAAQAHGIRLHVVKLSEAKHGFVLLPRRWVVERSFAWMTRFRRLARDYERLPETLVGLHLLAFTVLMLHRFALIMTHYP